MLIHLVLLPDRSSVLDRDRLNDAYPPLSPRRNLRPSSKAVINPDMTVLNQEEIFANAQGQLAITYGSVEEVKDLGATMYPGEGWVDEGGFIGEEYGRHPMSQGLRLERFRQVE